MKINRRSFSEGRKRPFCPPVSARGKPVRHIWWRKCGQQRAAVSSPSAMTGRRGDKTHGGTETRDASHMDAAYVILLLTVQFLSVAGHSLCSERSLDQPCKPYADLTRHQQPERASRLVLGISQPNTKTRQ